MKTSMVNPIKSMVLNRCVKPLILGTVRLSAAGISRYELDDAAHEIFQGYDFHLLKKHFYLPIPDASELGDAFWERQSQLAGVNMNDENVLVLLRDVFPGRMEEFRECFPLHSPGSQDQFYLINGSFMAVDAHVYYAFIRHFRPRRIVEVGAGNSTLVAAAACERNQREDGWAAHLTAIDPFPTPFLKNNLRGLSELLETKVQDVDLDLFTSLEAGDILFIDSTHVLREGNDVQFEYCEVLPRLAPGVLVHVHDISLPKPYPRVYFEQNHLYWNEQYLLQAFLAYNSRFEVIWPGNYMILNYPERVLEVFPEYHAMREAYPSSEPSSFWMRVKP